MNRETEPVRLSGWAALAAGAALQAAILWSAGTPPAGIVGAIAAVLTTQIGGLEWARRQVWSPSGHFREIRQVETMTDEGTGA